MQIVHEVLRGEKCNLKFLNNLYTRLLTSLFPEINSIKWMSNMTIQGNTLLKKEGARILKKYIKACVVTSIQQQVMACFLNISWNLKNIWGT